MDRKRSLIKDGIQANVESEVDLNNIQLSDVLDIEFIQGLQDDFAKAVGVASVTVDLEGHPVTHPSSYTRFCMDYIHSTVSGDRRCAESHQQGGKKAALLGRPVVYECHAGLIDFAAPIILEGRQIGTILGGQVLTDSPNEEKYCKIAHEIGVDEAGYIGALGEIRQLSKASIEAAANILFIVANNMSTTKYNQKKLAARSTLLSHSLDEIVHVMQEIANSAKRVRVDQVKLDKSVNHVMTSKIDEVMDLAKTIADTIAVQKTEMARLDRLNLIGEMAASIGHEIRNPLTTVRGFLQYFSNKNELKKYKGDFDVMIEELDRANEIITEFLSLSKNRIVDLKILDLNRIIKKIMPLLQAKGMLKNIDIKLELEHIPRLLLDEKKCIQLLLNLVINSIEATEKDGIVTIKTFLRNETPILAVSDKGYGISKNILEQLGTPFVSTKSQGTGLGLAVCYRIAEDHSALINIHSQEGQGTTVEVIFNAVG
jgi:signal transduction histidine kinase